MYFLVLTLLWSLNLINATPTPVSLVPRSTSSTCSNLHVLSNNGDRKIAIVIDTSGSMSESDPYNLRLEAGKRIVDWLISDAEAKGSNKADQVAVIDFADSAHLDYALGDPGNANSAFDSMGADGGTFIADGVDMAIAQLTADGSGDTAKRSGIFVFTDGEVKWMCDKSEVYPLIFLITGHEYGHISRLDQPRD
jgi:Mg-chelatase subunit ChlD